MSNVRTRLSMLSLILLATSGCVTGSIDRAPATVSDYCLIAKPIGYDTTKDSTETVTAIEAHNSQWVCVCEKDCPSRPEG
jgi:hypothetical protein